MNIRTENCQRIRFTAKSLRIIGLLTVWLLLATNPFGGGLLFAQEEGQTQEEEKDEMQESDDPEMDKSDDKSMQESDAIDPDIVFANPDDIGEPIVIPIMDREPFDRLTFNDNNLKENGDNWVLDVDPVEIENLGRHDRINLNDQEGRLVFTIEQDYPGRRFACPWSSLVSIERYSDLVLTEAEKAMDAGDYDTAFRTLLFLSELGDFGQTAKLKGMLDTCLYEDGHKNLEDGNFGEALTAFDALYQRSPRYKVRGAETLLDKITTCINEFIREKVDEGDYGSARSLLTSMRLEYGNKVENVMRFWELDMRKKAIERLREAKRDSDAGNGMAAHEGARDVIYVMPSMKQSATAYNAVVDKFPYVFVGVTQQAGSLDVRRIEDWAARRVGYMVNRWLLEFQQPSDEGGDYLFPAGTIRAIDEEGVKFRMQLHSELPHGVPPMESFEMQDRLFELATVGSDEYYVPWARLVDTIEIENERSVVFTLKYPHVRPESLLVMPWFAPNDARAVESFGKYQQVQASEGEVIYELNDRYPKIESEQNPRIIERVFRDSSDATEALIRGQLDVVDRIYPGDIARLKANPNIRVEPYLIPSVHMLIPNPRNDYMESDSFRRALHFGINRRLIIRDVIAGGGRNIDGFDVVSGPFPKGTDEENDLAYAYNFRVKDREHSALLGLVLAQQYVTLKQKEVEDEVAKQSMATVEEGEQPATPQDPNVPQVEMPTVVLAYPATETIAASCKIIAQQWRAIGVETELRPLPPGVMIPEDDNYDLVYVETQMQEPLIDAYRLFGRGGLSKVTDPTIEQALRNLDTAYSWKLVSDALQRVHQQSANNLSVLPLWQVIDHYAYRKNVFNLGTDIVFLYENLNEWRIGSIPLPEDNQ